MEIWQVLVMSMVEGITEFLPISSTGHMILAARLLGIVQTDFVKSFEIFIQLGAIAAVVVYEITKITKITEITKLTKNIMAAFVPTAIIGFILYKFVKGYLIGNSWVTVAALLIGGIFMIIFEKTYKAKPESLKIEDLSYKKAGIIGVFQALAVIPGVSRALMTIFGGMTMGLSRKEAVEMSFILAVPTMAAATGLDLVKSGWAFTGQEWILLLIGFLGAFGSAWVVVKWLINYVQKHDFVAFGIYRIIIALLFIFLI